MVDISCLWISTIDFLINGWDVLLTIPTRVRAHFRGNISFFFRVEIKDRCRCSHWRKLRTSLLHKYCWHSFVRLTLKCQNISITTEESYLNAHLTKFRRSAKAGFHAARYKRFGKLCYVIGALQAFMGHQNHDLRVKVSISFSPLLWKVIWKIVYSGHV